MVDLWSDSKRRIKLILKEVKSDRKKFIKKDFLLEGLKFLLIIVENLNNGNIENLCVTSVKK